MFSLSCYRVKIMMMPKARGVFILIAALMFLLGAGPARAKEIYKWVDEKGTVHFAEDESGVPEGYRGQLEKRSLKEDSKTPKDKEKDRKQDGKGAKEQSAGKKEAVNVNKIEGDVIESVKTIISLWKDGKYNLLYDHGDQKSRMSINKEEFERRMKKKGIGLASSWETIRDIQVEVKSATLAYATARVGYKSTKGGETKFRTETYRMSFEKGMWKISLTKILSAGL
jgi:hypothetical protein